MFSFHIAYLWLQVLLLQLLYLLGQMTFALTHGSDWLNPQIYINKSIISLINKIYAQYKSRDAALLSVGVWRRPKRFLISSVE